LKELSKFFTVTPLPGEQTAKWVMAKRDGTRSQSVIAIGAELEAFVGKRVRLHLRSRERCEGVLVSAPLTFNAVSGKGRLVKRGRIVLDVGTEKRAVVKLEDVETYDVLPSRAPAAGGTPAPASDSAASTNLRGLEKSRAG
jgi:small nuclear ribonucleoprotein (snRNP)-like protein